MKQKLLKTWLMLVLLLVGAGTTWAETKTIEINTTNSGVTGSYNDKTFDVNDVTFGFTQWMKNNNIQAKKSTTNSCYNVDAIPGNIKKITVVQTGTARAIKMYGGTSSKPTTEITAPSTDLTMVFDFTGDNYTYFSMTTPANAVYINTITIEYETSGGGGSSDPVDASWSVSPTSVSVKANANETVSITTNYDGTLSVSSDKTEVATATISGKTITVTGVAEGTATLTVSGAATSAYNAISKTIDVTVTSNTRPANEIFYESFDTNDGTGGNDGQWSGSIASNAIKSDNEGWTFVKESGADKCAKFGTGSALGSAQTPALAFRGNATLTFKAAAWNSGSESTTLKLSVNVGTISSSTVTLKKGEWDTYEVTLTNTTAYDQKITFVGNKAASSRFFLDEISVVKTDAPTPSDKTLESIAVTGTAEEMWIDDAFNRNGITVTATYDDATTEDVTSASSFSGYDMNTVGNQTVTVTYQEKTATYDIVVKTIANTQETAYTVAEAKALIDAGKDLNTEVYVAGTVSAIVTAYNSSYGNISFNVSADGQTTGDQFQFFRNFKGADKTKWTDEDTKPAVGDQVVGLGKLTKYNSTYEFAEGNYIISLTHGVQVIPNFIAQENVNVNVNDNIDVKDYLNIPADYEGDEYAITTSIDGKTESDNEFVCVYNLVDFSKAGTYVVDVVAAADGKYAETKGKITFNVTSVTLTSIAVSGTPTKTEYYVGDAFETAGLVVTGTYSDSHQETITEGIEWTVDPETLAVGTTSVDVLAGVGSIISEVYTVNGLTVTKPDFETVTYEFSEFTSGQSVELTDLNGFVITLSKNTGTSNPAWSSNQARVYAKGSLTIKANNATIKSIEYEYTVNANSKGATPTIDGVEGTTTAGTWDEENKTWTGADEEVTFSTSGTAGNIGFTKLIIKYVESSKITPTLTFSAPTAEVTIGANDNVFPTLTTTPADLEGVTFESSNTAVATINENTGAITLVAAGETTITAKYAGNEDYAAATPASYTLTVSKAPFVPTPVAEGYEDVDFTTVEPYQSLATNGSAEMTTYEGKSFSTEFAKKAGTNNAPKFYQNGNAVRAYVDNTITITAAEPIYNVNMAWVNGYVDDAVSITGLGTTTAVVTFSKTCRFTDITVYYQQYTRSLTNAWGTICLPYDFKADATTTYYSITSVQMEEGTPVAMALTKETELKAGVPYIFCSSNTEAGLTCTATGTNGAITPATVNGMTGSFTKHDIEAGMYLLSGNQFVKVAAGSNVGANRAYIDMSNVPTSSAGVKADVIFGFNGDITDGIIGVESNERNAQYFDLSGRRVMNPAKGLYIVNGKKVMK